MVLGGVTAAVVVLVLCQIPREHGDDNKGYSPHIGGGGVGEGGGGGGGRKSAEELERLRGVFREAIEVSQRPEKEACREEARLLVINFDTENNFEGMGSALSAVAEALAQGIHSGRTVVFGPKMSLPSIFIRDVAGCPSARPKDESGVPPSGQEEEEDPSPVECFLAPLSTCSWADVSATEITAFGSRMLDESARVKLSVGRRGIARFAVPSWLVEDVRDRDDPDVQKLWNGALLEYAIRLAPEVEKELEESMAAVQALPGKKIGVHIRHGDLSLRHLDGRKAYTNRAVRTLDEYLDAVRDLVADKGDVGSIVLATDDEKAEAIAEAFRASFPSVPVFLMDALRTNVGTHTATTLKALPADEVLRLQTDGRDLTSGESVRRMLVEALRDMSLLSECEYMVGSVTSFFSTLPAGWRAAKGHMDTPVYLDADEAASGGFHPALYHGSLHTTQYLAEGWTRWYTIMARFLDVVWTKEAQQEPGAPWIKFNPSTGLMDVPLEVFDNEAVYWGSGIRDVRETGCDGAHLWAEKVGLIGQVDMERDQLCLYQLNDAGADLSESWSYDKAHHLFMRALDRAEERHIIEVLEENIDASFNTVRKTMRPLLTPLPSNPVPTHLSIIGGPFVFDAKPEMAPLYHFHDDPFPGKTSDYVLMSHDS